MRSLTMPGAAGVEGVPTGGARMGDTIMDTGEADEAPATSVSSAPRHERTKRRRRRIIGVWAMGVFAVLAAAATVVALLFPNTAERVYGDAQIFVGHVKNQASEIVLDQNPVAHLGVTGGLTQLNWCDGTFTHMQSYTREKVPPIWAAHNNCGGDVVLPLGLGDEIDLIRADGSTETYTVVDIRETSKTWTTTEDLEGIDGDLALQSCYYGRNVMKFIGLSPSNTLSAPR